MNTITPLYLEKIVHRKKVFIDRNIIIYLTDTVAPFEALSRKLFEMIENGEVSVCVSIVSVVEVVQGPIKRGYYRTALQVRDYLFNFPNLVCVNITGEILDHLGKDQRIKWSKLRTVDSLIVALAVKNKVDKIISNDTHFRQANPKDLLISFIKNQS